MVNRYCECCHRLAGRPDAATNFYNDHFIPTHWALNYFKLSECLGVSLMGCCTPKYKRAISPSNFLCFQYSSIIAKIPRFQRLSYRKVGCTWI